MIERVRSIRASERRIWQQITDIFAECSIDYDKESEITKRFYVTVQNKFHYAITGKTAAEIIYDSADHTKENMGLTTWKNAPDGRILKSDSIVTKNYLDEKEIRQLERAVTGYFDYIEDLIERENVFSMKEFSDSINAFLEFRRYDILKDNGKISHKQAQEEQEMLHEMVDAFEEKYKDEAEFNITICVENEVTYKETVLVNPKKAADIYAFVDDQFSSLDAAMEDMDVDTADEIIKQIKCYEMPDNLKELVDF